MYIDNITLFTIEENELKSVIQAVKIYRDDIGTEFGIKMCEKLIMKSGKRQMTEGRELPNQEKIRTPGETETYKYLGILEEDTIKQTDIKLSSSSCRATSVDLPNPLSPLVSTVHRSRQVF